MDGLAVGERRHVARIGLTVSLLIATRIAFRRRPTRPEGSKLGPYLMRQASRRDWLYVNVVDLPHHSASRPALRERASSSGQTTNRSPICIPDGWNQPGATTFAVPDRRARNRRMEYERLSSCTLLPACARACTDAVPDCATFTIQLRNT